MAKGPSYRVPYRRRREHKTDYKARRVLATSSSPRLVVRPSGRNILVQVVKSEVEGDHVLTQTSSSELVKRFGWRGGRKNTPSAYLLGFIIGKKALREEVEAAVLDVGLRNPTKGSKLFAIVKGASDAGFEVPCDGKIMPSPERYGGNHVAEYAKNLKETPEAYEQRFSNYIKQGLSPEDLPGHFSELKSRIEEAFSG